MPLLRRLCLIGLFGFCSLGLRAQERTVNLPTDEEIRLVLTQLERAIQQYKPLVDVEETAFGKDGPPAAAKDRQLIKAIEVAIKAFEKTPQGFNGPLGFSFVEWIDDVDRNALLCASGAASSAAVSMIDGDTSKAQVLVGLSQNCSAVGNLFYTISENAGALYTRFVQKQDQALQEAAEVARECRNVLKQKGASPKR